MTTTIEKTGKTIEDALKAALEELSATESDVEYEVLEEPRKGILGLIGTRPAKIRVTLKPKDEPTKEQLPTVEPPIVEEPTVEEPIEEKIEPPIEKPIEEPTVEKESEAQSEEEIEAEAIECAKEFLRTVLGHMKLEVQIEGHEAEEGYLLDITGKNLGLLIGKHGQTLDALQYLVNLAANRQQNHRMHFVLDVEGYRKKRTEALNKLAKGLSERVAKMKKELRLEPMSRYERKGIHLALQDSPKVTTHSAGTEPYRYVIITPKKPGDKN